MWAEVWAIFAPLVATGAILTVALTILSAILEAKNANETESAPARISPDVSDY